jgi:hypothetical protein
MQPSNAFQMIREAQKIGKTHPTRPDVEEVDMVDLENRETVARYLLLNAVLDQGPDITGVRMLLKRVMNRLYQEGFDILNDPNSFFSHLPYMATVIEEVHKEIKEERAQEWAQENDGNPSNYSLFFAQSAYGSRSLSRVSWYLLGRWGSPFLLYARLEHDGKTLREFLEESESAEKMGSRIKSHDKYGIDKAIGNKAFHLFTKWYIDEFNLVSEENAETPGWNTYSYELPLDSNVGRVLFRTGWFRTWIEQSELEDAAVRHHDREENGETKHYLRVTDIRGERATKNVDGKRFQKVYNRILTEHLTTKSSRWRKVEIQHLLNVVAYATNTDLGSVDDGLLHVGMEYCLNHSNPRCEECPLNEFCEGYQEDNSLIEEYRT